MGKKTYLQAALAVVLLVLVPAVPAHAQESVTIGAVMPITGVFGFAGVEALCSEEDAIDMANEQGGIAGKKIRFVVEDGQYKQEVAMPLFEKIMSAEKPLMFFAESTAMAKALAPEMKNRYKMLMGSTSFSSELADTAMNPYTFVCGPTYGDMFGILLKYIAKEKKGAKVAFFYSDTEFGKDPIKFGKLMCEKLRLKLVAEAVVPLGAKDLAAQIMSLKAADPDYIVIQGFLVDPVPQVIKACRDLGMKAKFVGTFYGATKMLLDRLGPLADGYLAVNPYMYWWNDDVPMIKKIKDYTARKHPEVKYRDNFYMQGFMNMIIGIECMKRAAKAGQLNGEGVAKAFQTIKDFDTGGLTAPLTARNNRFPVARIWAANGTKGIFEPASDWIRLDKY